MMLVESMFISEMLLSVSSGLIVCISRLLILLMFDISCVSSLLVWMLVRCVGVSGSVWWKNYMCRLCVMCRVMLWLISFLK